VIDTGSGIPMETQKRIFERFFPRDNTRSYSSAESAGAGLGLPIARWIAEAHHGKLGAPFRWNRQHLCRFLFP